jgi:hypothetical protein
MGLLKKFLGLRISESRHINESKNGHDERPATKNLHFQRIEFIRINEDVPAWGGRLAIVLAFRYSDGGGGYDYLDGGRSIGYDVLVQDQDNPKKFTRLAKTFVDDEIELAEPEVVEELKSYIETKTLNMLALANPLTHELDLVHMPLNYQAA